MTLPSPPLDATTDPLARVAAHWLVAGVWEAEPPSGPAMPVTDRAMPARDRASAPAAMSSAVCSDTAPCAARVATDTPSISVLASFE